MLICCMIKYTAIMNLPCCFVTVECMLMKFMLQACAVLIVAAVIAALVNL